MRELNAGMLKNMSEELLTRIMDNYAVESTIFEGTSELMVGRTYRVAGVPILPKLVRDRDCLGRRLRLLSLRSTDLFSPVVRSNFDLGHVVISPFRACATVEITRRKCWRRDSNS